MASKKYFIFSDVHSYYDILSSSLYRAGFSLKNPDHIIVSLGDLLDRGPDPIGCLNFVNSLPEERKILIRGNHETLLDDLIRRKKDYSYDYTNGTIYTLFELSEEKCLDDFEKMCDSVKNSPYLIGYEKCLRNYAEIGNNIFVHGWIPCSIFNHDHGDEYIFNENWKTGDWDTASWINGMEAWNQGVRIPGKTIYCGHWHASYGHSKIHKEGPEFDNRKSKANFKPFIDDGICAMDACTNYSHKINIEIIEDDS